MLSDLDASVARRLPQSEALRLLTSYVTSLGGQALNAPELRQAAATHMRDLIVLAVGGTRDARVLAETRGLRATRLAAMKADILASLSDERFSVAMLAARHHVTPRYVQMLFEAEGRTFSKYVLEQRLARAYQLLSDARLVGRTISSIAFHVGFSNLSYFNRTFRLRYGMKPSELRGATGGNSPR
jgi:AraC-like DNA-binding protein